MSTAQRYLTKVGNKVPSTGYFGKQTQGAVRAWERKVHHRRDGRLTPSEATLLKMQATKRKPKAGGNASEAASRTAPPSGGAAPTTTPTEPTAPGGKARLLRDGTALAPSDAPQAVKDVIAAGNEIAHNRYTYGGGHNAQFRGPGYDCSGSVSYALHGGDLLDSPLPSYGFYNYGRAGTGKWITLYANDGHMYMVVAGLRFDTSGLSADGTRWHKAMRSNAGFKVRHPTGY